MNNEIVITKFPTNFRMYFEETTQQILRREEKTQINFWSTKDPLFFDENFSLNRLDSAFNQLWYRHNSHAYYKQKTHNMLRFFLPFDAVERIPPPE